MSEDAFKIDLADVPNQLRLRASRMCADGYAAWDAALDRSAAEAIEALEAEVARLTRERDETAFNLANCRAECAAIRQRRLA